VKLLIVEDDSMMSKALASSLATHGIEEIRTANSAALAMQLFKGFNPDVCLIDIELKVGPTGVDVSHAMRRANSKIGIVFLTSLADPRLVDSRIPELPTGSIYLMKSAVENLQQVVESLKIAHAGEVKSRRTTNDQPFLDLSKSQFEMLRLIAQGHSNIEISKLRFTTIKSTENSISRLAKKLGIANSTNASQRVLLSRKYAELTGKM
jgi:two-component system nitrate/nitrite response regulator NarL